MRIDSQAMTIRLLLTATKYRLDFYQREYSWQTQHVSELIDDLTSNFLDNYKEGDNPTQISSYGHYFLGSIIVSRDDGKNYIVDGQQRITTLTLLIIMLYHLLEDDAQKNLLEPLIHSLAGGEEGFNLDFGDGWEYVFKHLYPIDKRNDETFDVSEKPEFVRNIVARYNDIEDYFEIQGDSLLSFVFWLLENVYLVTISAFNTRDAYSIFETVNDRGLPLTPVNMLRGYLLSNIEDSEHREQASEVWSKSTQTLKRIGKNEESEAIKAWLRCQYAQNISDFDEIGSEFHRWVGKHERILGLKSSDDFANFIERDFKFYIKWYYRLRNAANSLTDAVEDGLECVYYNAQHNKFTLQYPLLLAALNRDDSKVENLKKVRIAAEYLDILIYRRIWNSLSIAQNTMASLIPTIIPIIRGKSSSELTDILYTWVQETTPVFANNTMLRLQSGNRRKIFLILARMTDYVSVQSGDSSHYQDYMRTGKNSYEVEHIWAKDYTPHANEFDEQEFDEYRDRIGGLLLLPKSVNASVGDKSYAEKRNVYSGQNLLAQSLHENAYLNKPGFRKFRDASGLDFKSHNEFNKKDLDERQELYLQLAEQIWNPKRLKTDYGTESGNTGEQDLPSGCEDKHHSEDSVLVEDGDNKSLEKWTGKRIKEIVPEERREHYEKKHRSRVNEFYRRAAELQNFVEVREWKLPLKFRKYYCSFYIGSKRVFGVRIHYSPPKFAVFLSEKEFEGLKDYCEPEDYCKSRRYAFYPVGTTIEQLSPILEYAYKKLQGY